MATFKFLAVLWVNHIKCPKYTVVILIIYYSLLLLCCRFDIYLRHLFHHTQSIASLYANCICVHGVLMGRKRCYFGRRRCGPLCCHHRCCLVALTLLGTPTMTQVPPEYASLPSLLSKLGVCTRIASAFSCIVNDNRAMVSSSDLYSV